MNENNFMRVEDVAKELGINLVAWYDRLDANRQRREHYHELFRSGDDVPLDYGASEDVLLSSIASRAIAIFCASPPETSTPFSLS